MSTDKLKLDKFSRAVYEEVNAQIVDIMSNAEKQKNEILSKANDTSLSIAYDKIKEDIKKINSKYQKIVASEELNAKREVLKYREELVAKVFIDIKLKLAQYTSSAEYTDTLINSIKNEISNHPQAEEIILGAKDIHIADNIKSIIGDNVKVTSNKSIKLGGYYLKEGNIIIDKTIDSSIDEQKELFNSNCGLNI